jgi:hypothetical protein
VGGLAARGMVMKVQELGAGGGGSEFSAILRVDAAAVDGPLGLIRPVLTYRLLEFAVYSPPHDWLEASQKSTPPRPCATVSLY